MVEIAEVNNPRKKHMKLTHRIEMWWGLAAILLVSGALTAAAGVPDVLPDPDDKAPDTTKPVKVYFLSGQSNMVGMGRPATLTPLATSDEKFGYLIDDNGAWTTRKDVYYINYVMDKRTNDCPLTVFGRFGPEVGIGHVLGHYHDEQVLLIKGSCGNRSLGWDFCPPSAVKRQGREQEVADCKAAGKWYAGTSYDRYVKHAKAVLADLENNLPGYKGQGYELAGIFWWQGHKDKGMAKEEYLQLLGELIEDFRKDFEAPNAKFVVATVAFNGQNLGAWQGVWEAQMAISQQAKFKDNCASVDIRDIGGGGFHYGNNGATYAKVGDRMGRAMVKLLDKDGGKKPDNKPATGAIDPNAPAPMPEGLDQASVSRSLRPAVLGLSNRKYGAVIRLLDRMEKVNAQQRTRPGADSAALDAELKDIQTMRKFAEEQIDGAMKRINAYVKAGNPYRANQLILESNRYCRGVEAYDTTISMLQRDMLNEPNKTALRQGAEFYKLLDNAQRVRNERTVGLLAKFAEQAGDSTYGKAASAAVAALTQDPKAELDGDTLVAEQAK